MSEVKLNLVDAERTLVGTIHGSIADACVAALSAEPETIAELEAALARYVKPVDQLGPFNFFHSGAEIDKEPWDAGVVIIDLEACVVAADSSYSQPQPEGEVLYHNGTESTDVSVLYRVPKDWEFFNSLIEYESCRLRRRTERTACPPLDARNVLYGRALLEFVVTHVRQLSVCREHADDYSPKLAGHLDLSLTCKAVAGASNSEEPQVSEDEAIQEAVANEISAVHARWLMTRREDLRGVSPRDLLLAKREFIDFDLHTRQLQWTFQGEGPPCLARQSFAYRFAGFGTHECVVYYDLVRHLLWSALENLRPPSTSREDTVNSTHDSDRVHQANELLDIEEEITRLEQIETDWLENPQPDFGGRAPANTIENERRRLPLVLSKREMIIDEDCCTCMMMANDPTMGPGFCHLDDSHMDDDFAFSDFLTREEWEAENRRREEFHKEFNRSWEERQQRIARGEQVDDEFNLDWVDSLNADSTTSPRPDDGDESRDVIQ
jgi:hypothetical protein